MHESHFVESLLKAVLKQARDEKSVRVTKIYLNLGDLSGYSPDHLQFHFEETAKETLAAGAQLICKIIPQSAKVQVESFDADS